MSLQQHNSTEKCFFRLREKARIKSHTCTSSHLQFYTCSQIHTCISFLRLLPQYISTSWLPSKNNKALILLWFWRPDVPSQSGNPDSHSLQRRWGTFHSLPCQLLSLETFLVLRSHQSNLYFYHHTAFLTSVGLPETPSASPYMERDDLLSTPQSYYSRKSSI